MTQGPVPDPFTRGSAWEVETPRPIAPVPAAMSGALRGRRVLIGIPGHGWRGDLRADDKVVQGSRTYVPVIPEAEWYRAEAEKTEVFAPLVPVDRVWVEELGMAPPGTKSPEDVSLLVSLDEPPRRNPTAAFDARFLTGRRVVELSDGQERRDLRAVTELHTSEGGSVCARVTTELEWYRWAWSGKSPRTLEIDATKLWVE